MGMTHPVFDPCGLLGSWQSAAQWPQPAHQDPGHVTRLLEDRKATGTHAAQPALEQPRVKASRRQIGGKGPAPSLNGGLLAAGIGGEEHVRQVPGIRGSSEAAQLKNNFQTDAGGSRHENGVITPTIGWNRDR